MIERLMAIPLPELEPLEGRDALRYPGGTGNVTHGEGIKRGVGLAVGYKNVAFSEGFDDAATARVTLSATPDGPVAEIYTAAVEMGQGLLHLLGPGGQHRAAGRQGGDAPERHARSAAPGRRRRRASR